MTRRRKVLLTIGVAAMVGVLSWLLAWRRLALVWMGAEAERAFRERLTSDQWTPGDLDPVDWAWRFGGRAGLGRLERLAADEALPPRAQLLAAQIQEAITSGAHVARLRAIMDAIEGRREDIEPPGWPTSALMKYIAERDAHLQKVQGAK